MNYSTSDQQSNAYSGLRGTKYQDAAADSNMAAGGVLTNQANELLSNPQQFRGQTGQQLLPGGRYGLGSNSDMAVDELGKQMFSRTSANTAGRGFVSPENQSMVAGSAMQSVLPQLIPQTQAWQQAQFQAPMQLGQYAMSVAKQPADFWNQALGAQSQSSGSSFGFGFDPSKLGSTTAGGGGTGMGMFLA